MKRDGLIMFDESFANEKKIVNLIYQKVFYERSFDNWKMSLEGGFLLWVLGLHDWIIEVTVIFKNATFLKNKRFFKII